MEDTYLSCQAYPTLNEVLLTCYHLLRYLAMWHPYLRAHVGQLFALFDRGC